MIQATLFDRPSGPAPLPPHNGTETSREAAESMREHVPRQRRAALDAWRAAGAAGLTIDAMEAATGISHQAAGPRKRELEDAGLIVQARDEKGDAVRRPTRSGRPAWVWVAAEFARGGPDAR